MRNFKFYRGTRSLTGNMKFYNKLGIYPEEFEVFTEEQIVGQKNMKLYNKFTLGKDIGYSFCNIVKFSFSSDGHRMSQFNATNGRFTILI